MSGNIGPQSTAVLPRTPPAPRVAVPPFAVIDRQVAVTQRVINQAQEVQLNRGLVIPSGDHVRAVKRGSIWLVVWMGYTLATLPRKKHARQLARTMNAFLDSYQTSALVDPASLLESLSLYAALAVDPAGDFIPPLNVRL